jgi:hypothetical protein
MSLFNFFLAQASLKVYFAEQPWEEMMYGFFDDTALNQKVNKPVATSSSGQ